MISLNIKNDEALPGFELGFFNLFGLIVLFPIFWVQLLEMFCWGICCCARPMSTFYQDNLMRLGVAGLAFLVLSGIEMVFLWIVLDSRQFGDFCRYGAWMLVRSLPVMCLLGALLALPGFNLIYLAIVLFSAYGLLGPPAIRHQWAPVFSLPGPVMLAPRHHLKGLAIYLSMVLVLAPMFFSMQAWGCSCGGISSVKANMHTLQSAIEIYAMDHQGQFPENLNVLKTEASRPGKEYWKEFNNPLSRSGHGRPAYHDMPDDPSTLFPIRSDGVVQGPFRDILGIRIYHRSFGFYPEYSGSVIYESEFPGRYFIYGLGYDGQFLIDKGEVLTLSNS